MPPSCRPRPFPVTEYLLCGFSAYLADQGLTPQTGVSYLSAVRSMQISLGLPDPRDESSLPYLKRVHAGIRRAQLNKAGQAAGDSQPPGTNQSSTGRLDLSPQDGRVGGGMCGLFWLLQAWRTPPGLTLGIQLSNVPGLCGC